GFLFVSLPDLVAADATFVLPRALHSRGEAVFLDASFHRISPVLNLQAAPVVPGSAGTGAFAGHVARRISFAPAARPDAEPARAAWLVINPPDPLRATRRDPYSYLNEVCGVTYGEWRR